MDKKLKKPVEIIYRPIGDPSDPLEQRPTLGAVWYYGDDVLGDWVVVTEQDRAVRDLLERMGRWAMGERSWFWRFIFWTLPRWKNNLKQALDSGGDL